MAQENKRVLLFVCGVLACKTIYIYIKIWDSGIFKTIHVKICRVGCDLRCRTAKDYSGASTTFDASRKAREDLTQNQNFIDILWELISNFWVQLHKICHASNLRGRVPVTDLQRCFSGWVCLGSSGGAKLVSCVEVLMVLFPELETHKLVRF